MYNEENSKWLLVSERYYSLVVRFSIKLSGCGISSYLYRNNGRKMEMKKRRLLFFATPRKAIKLFLHLMGTTP